MDVQRISALSASVALIFMLDDDDLLLSMHGKERRHRYWMAPYLKDRPNPNQRNTLAKLEMDFLRLGSVDEFRATLRMSPDIYKELIDLISPVIKRVNTNYRVCISVEERLSMTMRYLAFGDSTRTLHQAYLVGYSTVLPLIKDTCRALYQVLHSEYLKTPSTKEEWLLIADGFQNRWNLPHVLGAVDGKHVRIKCPPNSGSLFYNYKNYFSIVLLAVVNHNYEFIFADVGSEGRASDSRIWKDSHFFQDVESPDNPLQIPQESPIQGITNSLPYFFVGDDAFALGCHMMKPFPSTNLSYEKRIFNYRLSRCRRIVENAFGILSSRFQILMRQQNMDPSGVQIIVMATIVLHNFLRSKAAPTYMPRGAIDQEDQEHIIIPGNWRNQRQMDSLSHNQSVRNRSIYVKNIRMSLAQWCTSKQGEVPWQYEIIPNDID